MIVTDWGSIGNYEGPDKWVKGQPACLTEKCLAQRAANCLLAGTDQDLKGGYFNTKVANKPLPDAEQVRETRFERTPLYRSKIRTFNLSRQARDNRHR